MIPRAYVQEWSASAPWPEAFGRVWKELIVRIKGDAWKLTDKAIEELRGKKYPKLLK